MEASILLTGATGFVGRRLAACLIDRGTHLVCPVRGSLALPGASVVTISSIDEKTDWSQCLAGVGTVIHAAARVHVMNERALDPLAEFRRVNVDGSLNFARQAAAAGVKRFIFLSSAKVSGEESPEGRPFNENDPPAPEDAYAISKYEAEQGLLKLATTSGMEVTIIRPPLVYGPGVKANFENMLRWVYRGIPLPFGAIRNKRSLVYIDNLTSLVCRCIDHPAAANEIFFVSDGQDMSMTELLKRCANALGVKSRLIPVPQGFITAAATLLGRPKVAQRLCGSLQVDVTKATTLLSWAPPLDVDAGLQATAANAFER